MTQAQSEWRTIDHQVEVDGGQVFARQWQPLQPTALAPVLLLHDSLGAVEMWKQFPEQLCLASGRAVFAYDRLGFGRSSARLGLPGVGFVRDEGARVLPELCRALGLERAVLCGHSVGGGMAVEAAVAAPQRHPALVTIAAQAFVEQSTRDGIIEAKRTFADPWVMQRLEAYHGDKARWVVDAWTRVWLSEAFADWNLDEALAHLQVPTLAIHGSRDEYGSPEHPRRIAAHAAGRVHLLDGVGHVPHRECTDRLVQVVAEFLRGVD